MTQMGQILSGVCSSPVRSAHSPETLHGTGLALGSSVLGLLLPSFSPTSSRGWNTKMCGCKKGRKQFLKQALKHVQSQASRDESLVLNPFLRTRPKYTPYRETGVAITSVALFFLFCGIGDYRCYTPTSCVKVAYRRPKTGLTRGGYGRRSLPLKPIALQ